MPWPNAINLQDPPSRDDFLSHFWFRRFLVDGFSVAHGVSWGVLQSCGIPKSTWVSILNCLRWMIWEYSPILGNLHMRDWDHCKVSTFHCVLNARMRCIWIFHVNRRLLEDVGTNYTTVLYIWIWLNMVDYSPTPLFRLESDCEISQLIFLLFLFFCCNAMHKICVYIYIYTCVCLVFLSLIICPLFLEPRQIQSIWVWIWPLEEAELRLWHSRCSANHGVVVWVGYPLII